jgi:hypothetical protein
LIRLLNRIEIFTGVSVSLFHYSSHHVATRIISWYQNSTILDDYFSLLCGTEQSWLEEVIEYNVLVYEEMMRFLLEKKKCTGTNVLFPSTSVVVNRNPGGGIHDRVTCIRYCVRDPRRSCLHKDFMLGIYDKMVGTKVLGTHNRVAHA